MRALLGLLMLCLAASVARAQEGQLDPSFNGGLGYRLLGYTNNAGEDSRATAIAIAPDGSIFVAGFINLGGGALGPIAITKLTPIGYPDGSFNAGIGTVNFGTPGTYSYVSSMAVQSDGKVIALINDYGVSRAFLLQRFNADGSPDTAFGPGGQRAVPFTLLAGGYPANASLQLLPGDKILLGGTAYGTYSSAMALARLLPNGALDTTFGTGGQVLITRFSETQDHLPDQTLGSVTVLSNGSLLLVGATDYVYGAPNPPGPPPVERASIAFARLTGNGALDPTFGDGGVSVYDLGIRGVVGGYGGLVQPGGKFIVGAGGLILRFNANGTPDFSFGTFGVVPTLTCFDPATTFQLLCAGGFLMQSDGKLVFGGGAYNGAEPHYTFAGRLTAGGDPDPTFGYPALGPGVTLLRASIAGNGLNWENGGTLALQGNRLVIAGRAMWSSTSLYYKPIVYRLTSDSVLVDGFE